MDQAVVDVPQGDDSVTAGLTSAPSKAHVEDVATSPPVSTDAPTSPNTEVIAAPPEQEQQQQDQTSPLVSMDDVFMTFLFRREHAKSIRTRDTAMSLEVAFVPGLAETLPRMVSLALLAIVPQLPASAVPLPRQQQQLWAPVLSDATASGKLRSVYAHGAFNSFRYDAFSVFVERALLDAPLSSQPTTLSSGFAVNFLHTVREAYGVGAERSGHVWRALCEDVEDGCSASLGLFRPEALLSASSSRRRRVGTGLGEECGYGALVPVVLVPQRLTQFNVARQSARGEWGPCEEPKALPRAQWDAALALARDCVAQGVSADAALDRIAPLVEVALGTTTVEVCYAPTLVMHSNDVPSTVQAAMILAQRQVARGSLRRNVLNLSDWVPYSLEALQVAFRRLAIHATTAQLECECNLVAEAALKPASLTLSLPDTTDQVRDATPFHPHSDLCDLSKLTVALTVDGEDPSARPATLWPWHALRWNGEGFVLAAPTLRQKEEVVAVVATVTKMRLVIRATQRGEEGMKTDGQST